MDIYPLLISDQSKEIKRLHSMILKYNRLVDKLLNIDKKPSEILRSLTDEELFIFIVGKTLSFGRSLEKSCLPL